MSALTHSLTLKFDRMLKLEDDARTAYALEGMGADWQTRGRAADWTARIKAELFPLLDSLSEDETQAFIAYRLAR